MLLSVDKRGTFLGTLEKLVVESERSESERKTNYFLCFLKVLRVTFIARIKRVKCFMLHKVA